MSAPAAGPGEPPATLAFVESPVQLLNVLEWAHADALRAAGGPPPGSGAVPGAVPGAASRAADPAAA
ncbi:hypothetical protein RKE29_18315, partial [Streptomyces sp. B1866]|nr:hypothetical protein [Streptomyces sp. B1866]